MNSSMRKYVAEGIGTFVLVFGGVGAAVLAGQEIGFLGVSIAFGLSLLAMAYAIGPISGCHVNPAVTLAVFMSRKISGRDAGSYVVAQIIGAIIATAAIVAIAKGQSGGYDILANGLGANGYGEHSPNGYSVAACLVAEMVLTAILAFTVLGATSVRAPVGFAGLPIGLVLTLIHLVGIPITNTSVNPARSIGPALFVGNWAIEQLWMFIVAPLVGAVLAAGAHRILSSDDEAVISVSEAERALDSEQRERSAKP
jgi:aquaporin Z